MFKRITIYGIAFGSLSAAMLLVQYFNGLYKTRSFVASLPVIFNLLIPAIGVYLFVKSLMSVKFDKPINMGKALFGSLVVSLLVALCNIAAFRHIYSNEPGIMKEYRALQYASIEKYVNSDNSVAVAEKSKAIQEKIDNFEDNFSVSSFGVNQIWMCLSTGMVVALLVFVRNHRM